jgi:hypothetical protein
MSKSVKIRTLDENGENEEIVELVFEDEEWEILEDFAKYATELEAESTWIQEGMPASLNETWTEEEGFKVQADLPPRDQLAVLLELMGPFLLNDERTHFYSVRNFVAKTTDNKRVRGYLETLKHLYSGRRLQSIFVVAASSPDYPEGRIMNSEDMLLVWLHAYRRHRDKEKQKLFEALHGIVPPDATIAHFMFLLSDMVKAILGLQRLVSLFKGEEEQILVPILLKEQIHYLAYLHPTLYQTFPLELDPKSPRQLPEEGMPFTRVIDLTERGPLKWLQLVDIVGKLWMNKELLADPGDRHYFFRVGKGFTLPHQAPHEQETDIIVALKIQALLREEPTSEARRKPAETTLRKIRMHHDGRVSEKVPLRIFDTVEEVETFLERTEPRPRIDWIMVPRLAYEFAYWPVSRQAEERAHKIIAEGRKPTFEEVEGDISKAWEIFENEEPLEEEG